MSTPRLAASSTAVRTVRRLVRELARGLVLAGTLASLAILAPPMARACSCFPGNSLVPQFNAATDVVSVVLLSSQRGLSHVGRGRLPRIGRRRTDDDASAVRWLARVDEVHKGCARRGERIVITTPPSEGLCGIGALLEKGARLTVSGAFEPSPSGGAREIRALLCTLLDLEPGDLSALRGLGSCCGRACNLTPCEADLDCDTDHWCRPTPGDDAALTGACARLAGEGERCTTSAPAAGELRCSPGLECTRSRNPRASIDAPGTCRLPSSSGK